jgi:glycosyltransferase involved in cell wall biosynthesis
MLYLFLNSKMKPNPIRNFTIIIPAYNEEKRISKTLVEYANYFNPIYGERLQLLVVLNGCKDNTLGVVQNLQNKISNLQYINFDEPIGKGGAIIEGLKQTETEFVGYSDADGSTRPEIFHRLMAVIELTPSLDCVVGSREVAGAVVEKKTILRKIMSRGFNLVVNSYFRLGLRDTQCGAKVVKSSLLPKLLPNLHISDMAFDVNFLVDVHRSGGKILEMPIEWEDDAATTITNPLKTSLVMFLSITRLKLFYDAAWLYNIIRPISKWLYLRLLGKPLWRMGE